MKIQNTNHDWQNLGAYLDQKYAPKQGPRSKQQILMTQTLNTS